MVIRSCKVQTDVRPNKYASLDIIPEIGTIQDQDISLIIKVKEVNIRINKASKTHDNAITT